MWFWLSLIALLCWSGSDLFSKIGCQGEDDHLAHLKMVIAVGTVMGLHAAFEIFIGGTEISWSIIWTYLPVSLLYIGSMTLGYLGLRYIELSVSSPICNSSGALVAVMTLLFVGGEDYSPLALGAIVLVCVGAIGLGVVDATEDPELRAARQAEGNRKYSKSFLALALPVAYCLLDAAGTFADNRVLETLDEGSANCAYELTFLFVLHLRGLHQEGSPAAQARSAEVPRRHLRNGRSVCLYLCHRGHIAPCDVRADHQLLLRGQRAVEPPLPEGKALVEALRDDPARRHRHRRDGRVRYLIFMHKKGSFPPRRERSFFPFKPS